MGHMVSRWSKWVLLKCSPSGWMETPLFTEWFKSVFLPQVTHISEPKLLLMDGHVSHISFEVIDLARSNNVHLFCFPSNSSHLTQPIDVPLLRPAKTMFRKEVEKDGFGEQFQRNLQTIVHKYFHASCRKWKSFLTSTRFAGFEAAGKFINFIF